MIFQLVVRLEVSRTLQPLSPPGSDRTKLELARDASSQAQAGRGHLRDWLTGGGEDGPQLPLPGELCVVVPGVVNQLPAGAVSSVRAGLQVHTPVLTVGNVDVGPDSSLQQVERKLADWTNWAEQ